jgi:predicted small lipoprotein YifL
LQAALWPAFLLPLLLLAWQLMCGQQGPLQLPDA